MKRIDLIYIKAMAGMWEEAFKDAEQLPYYDHSLETDLNVMRSIHHRINRPKEGVPVKVVGKRRKSYQNLDINSEVWGVDEDEDENVEDQYYMGFDIYGPNNLEDEGINLMAALFYDKRINANPNERDVEEINGIIEENREIVETYRKLRKEGIGTEEARELALVEMYKRRAEEEGFEELPF